MASVETQINYNLVPGYSNPYMCMKLNESKTSLFLIPILIRGLKATKIMRGGKPQADSMEGIFTSRGLGFWGNYWMKE